MVLPQNQFDAGFEPMTFRSPVDRSTMKVTTDRNDFWYFSNLYLSNIYSTQKLWHKIAKNDTKKSKKAYACLRVPLLISIQAGESSLSTIPTSGSARFEPASVHLSPYSDHIAQNQLDNNGVSTAHENTCDERVPQNFRYKNESILIFKTKNCVTKK